MVESVKHAIVLLQIAKNSSCHKPEAADNEVGAVDSLEADLGLTSAHAHKIEVEEAEAVLEEGELIAVHCTRGLNRTGYMICR